jgi:hypothetical protein
MGVQLGYYLFLNCFCPGLVGIHPGDKSTLKNLNILVIGVYPGF